MAHQIPGEPANDTPCVAEAQFWFARGNLHRALEELDRLEPNWRAHPNVLQMRRQIAASTNDWRLSLNAASALVEAAPESPTGWIQCARALQRLNCPKEAASLLETAATRFPNDWMIRYHLARLACASKEWEKAWDWLNAAMLVHDPKKILAMAFEDADLNRLLTESRQK